MGRPKSMPRARSTRAQKLLWMLTHRDAWQSQIPASTRWAPSNEHEWEVMIALAERAKEVGLYSETTYIRDAASSLYRMIQELYREGEVS